MAKPPSFFKQATLFLLILCCVALLGAIPALSARTAEDGSSPQARGRQRARAEASKVIVGEYPPDFELPILTFDKDGAGKPIGVIHENKTFRLSSFRGKRPVCMIMSSYT